MNGYEDAVASAVGHLPAATLAGIATAIAGGEPVPASWAGPDTDRLAALIGSAATYRAGRLPAAAYLRGAAAGYARRAAEQQVEVVWGGPTMHSVPTRSMSQVLAELIGRSEKSLILMTYSAKPYPPVLTALSAALTRGVTVSIVVETLSGAGSAITGDEPAAAFTGLPGLDLWRWPRANRPSDHAKMHAKIAVADQRELLIGSANLTASGIDQSMEAALLITGGRAPQRTAALFHELVITNQLTRIN